MMENLHDGSYDDLNGKSNFNIEYRYVEHQLIIEIVDLRPVAA